MRTLLAIPARLTPLVVDALMTNYAAKAETISKAIVSEPGSGQFAPTRAHRDALLEVDELLDQLDFSPARRPIEIAGERDVLATAVHDALTTTIALLAAECDDYWRGAAGLEDIATANNTTRELLRLLRAIEIDATAPTPEPPS
ncbi:hypothetical protein Q5424_04870 [Conexibacter sp. JD483]|uniref:hypothetical protein n=1 Tax=unclassified Conexibacter TaxID=2627773 RepID=UPI00272657EB|nr:MULTISPECIES: hypothetical protein [unclassified Conexibacter]MDO8184665.1 hypothetical protein [Conexibacter sp. CPCC 205706]MDO8197971.1 hypothetical protein [Conexibacter sp. CPCC 205762]MDR9368401.1 hypothetical protein [Conexibacter sp. JD483]